MHPPLEFFFLGATIKVYAGISSAATIKVYTYNLRKKGGSGPSIPIILEKKGGVRTPWTPPLDPPMKHTYSLSLSSGQTDPVSYCDTEIVLIVDARASRHDYIQGMYTPLSWPISVPPVHVLAAYGSQAMKVI